MLLISVWRQERERGCRPSRGHQGMHFQTYHSSSILYIVCCCSVLYHDIAMALNNDYIWISFCLHYTVCFSYNSMGLFYEDFYRQKYKLQNICWFNHDGYLLTPQTSPRTATTPSSAWASALTGLCTSTPTVMLYLARYIVRIMWL